MSTTTLSPGDPDIVTCAVASLMGPLCRTRDLQAPVAVVIAS